MNNNKYLRIARYIVSLVKTSNQHEDDSDIPDATDSAVLVDKVPHMLTEIGKAIRYIDEHEEEFSALIKSHSIVRAVYILLKQGGFDLQSFHKRGVLRHIINAFIT